MTMLSNPRSPPWIVPGRPPPVATTKVSSLSGAPRRFVKPSKLTALVPVVVAATVPLPSPVSVQVVFAAGPSSVWPAPVAFTVHTFENVIVRSAVGVVTVPLPVAWSIVHVAVSPFTSSELAPPVALYVIGAPLVLVEKSTVAPATGVPLSLTVAVTVAGDPASTFCDAAPTATAGPLGIGVGLGDADALGDGDGLADGEGLALGDAEALG